MLLVRLRLWLLLLLLLLWLLCLLWWLLWRLLWWLLLLLSVRLARIATLIRLLVYRFLGSVADGLRTHFYALSNRFLDRAATPLRRSRAESSYRI